MTYTEGATTVNENAIDAKSYLLQYADLKLFWILRTKHIQPGLIHFLGSDGTAYVMMDDDDQRTEKCMGNGDILLFVLFDRLTTAIDYWDYWEMGTFYFLCSSTD